MAVTAASKGNLMNAHLREPTNEDWPAVLRAANASLPWRLEGNQEWLDNRRNFDEVTYQRRHYVVVDSASSNIVGYGAIEGGSAPGRYRVFVVMDAQLLPSAGEVLYQRLHEELRALGDATAWVREEARDKNVLDFFRGHGFANEQQFTTEQGLEVVTLERTIPIHGKAVAAISK
jgi:hypothetical protein